MSRRRGSTIGASPLDAVVPPKRVGKPDGGGERSSPQEPSPTAKRSAKRAAAPKRTAPERQPAPEERAVGKKERLTVHVPLDLVDRVKNAVYWTPGLTLARMAEEALLSEVERREKDRGGRFPTRAEELRGGRPMK